MRRFIMSTEDYEKFCKSFEQMECKANDYVPTISELKQIIEPNLKEYILFLLWILNTGKATEENKEIRKEIRNIIFENLDIEDD